MLRIAPRTGALFGWAAVAVWTALYLFAALSTPGYTITGNRLSDLGNPVHPSAWAFDAACILAGLLFFPFGWTIGAGMSRWMQIPGRGMMTIALAALVGVGAFPEESPYDLHFIMSAIFFVVFMMAISHFVVAMWRNPRYGHVSAALGTLASGLALFFILAVAIETLSGESIAGGVLSNVLEHVTVYAGLVWAAWNGLRLREMPTSGAA